MPEQPETDARYRDYEPKEVDKVKETALAIGQLLLKSELKAKEKFFCLDMVVTVIGEMHRKAGTTSSIFLAMQDGDGPIVKLFIPEG